MILVELFWATLGWFGTACFYMWMTGFSNEGPLYAVDALPILLPALIGMTVFGFGANYAREETDGIMLYWSPMCVLAGLLLFTPYAHAVFYAFCLAFLFKLLFLIPTRRSAYGN
jgi:hypothetical protein